MIYMKPGISPVLLIVRECSRCKSDSSRNNQWYRVRGTNKYCCGKCYDHERRFQDFKAKLAKRKCSRCKSKETLLSYTKRGFPYRRWTRDGKGGWFCNKCYNKMTFTPAMRRKWNQKTMKYRNIRITLPFNPRIGTCSWCGKTNLAITHMHHIQYHNEDPLKDAIELCLSCHAKETWKQRKKGV